MRKWLWLAVCLVAIGCGPVPGEVATDTTGKAVPPPVLPDPMPSTRLGLWRDGMKVRPGQGLAEAKDVFPQPKGAVVTYDKPTVIPNEYRAYTWETDSEGYGLLSSGGKLVMALRVEYEVAASRVTEVVEEYQNEHGPADSVIDTSKVDYWFWERPPYRLAICTSMDADGNRLLTSAVGVATVLDLLTLSPEKAQGEAVSALALLSKPPE